MTIKILSLQEAVGDNGLKVLVHGPAGIGKTVLCATTGERTLMLSAEAGLLSIKEAPSNIQVVVVKTIADVIEVYDMLVDVTEDPDTGEKIVTPKDHPYKWLCLDSVSEIAEVLLSDEKASVPDPRQAYGNLQDEMTKLLRAFRDIPRLNVVMTAKQIRFTDEVSGITTYLPGMPGTKLPQQIAYLFDEVFALRVMKNEAGEEERVLQTFRCASYDAKDRSGKLRQYEKANLRHIYNTIHPTPKSADEKAESASEEPQTETTGED